MKRPVILIFPTRRDDLSAVSVRYTDAVRCHGGLPLVVPMNTDAAALEEMCAISDGFMFTGGVDIAPSYYNEEKLNDTVETDEVRDTLEMTAIGYVLASDKPVLGICRGIQSVNVGMGGTLYQDIPAQLPDPVCHRQNAPATEPTHDVFVVPGTRLHALIGDKVRTNSFHHQAVKDPAPGLVISARAEDGVIEALESTGDRYITLVQWHPEFTHSTDPCSDALFGSFIKASSKQCR
ncbi:MAG: gamma-glutamyl-gamma-aminobutyrate hydrolase family protein [Clostridia bacterium]|nr:gamma-glutamyl-gamma-aminobutyrate hydrolase family protein [Clostridia bacterium]